MKKTTLSFTSVFLFIGIGLFAASCTKETVVKENDTNGVFDTTLLIRQINALPKESLSLAEKAGLTYLREEEKLARDVYFKLYEKYGVRIFNNIYNSEVTHTNAVYQLLRKYELQDPFGNNGVGVFTDQNLQNLYNTLIAKGNQSLLNAYQVGATIEDVDLFDIKEKLAVADNQDIKLVYEMLAKGSRNHMRAFYKNLVNIGGSYTPQYITQAEFDAIINSPTETGF
jgi:hypothetical protein